MTEEELEAMREHVMNLALCRWRLICEVERQLEEILNQVNPAYPVGESILSAYCTITDYKRDEAALIKHLESED